MRTLGMGMAIITGLVLALSGPVWSDAKEGKKKDESKEKIELADAAKVPIEQAIKSASEKAAGKVIEAELEKEHGKIVWEVEVVTAEGKIVKVHVDAGTGEVIDVEEKHKDKKK